MPSAEAARKFLRQFHDAAKIEEAQQQLALDRVAYIAGESEPLQGLAAVNRDVVQELGRRCAAEKIATVDLDATIIESWKREAKPTYEGTMGYQPVLALWAEMNVVLADEFRDGNVPAHQALLPVAKRAFQSLPETVTEFYFRGDSACEEDGLLARLHDEQRQDGPKGKIGFAVSARMNPGLQAAISTSPQRAGSPTARIQPLSRSAPKWITCRSRAWRTATASPCAISPSASVRSKANCSPTAVR